MPTTGHPMANSTARPVANPNSASSFHPLLMKPFTSALATLSPSDSPSNLL
ncbi:MAG: hypothetical protein WCK09_18205 [Bacteroidota bacterium]